MHKKTSMKTSELVDNHIQNFIWGGILSDIWSEIQFYTDT